MKAVASWSRTAAIGGLLALLIACADRIAGPPTRVAPAPASVASLLMSDSAPVAGGLVTLTARLATAAMATRAGAYAAHIEYDPSLVTYVGQGDATSGLAAFHADAGVLRVAGASLDGYADGVLFRARFRVTRRLPQAELRLVIDELRDVGLADRLPSQPSRRSALLRPWP